MDVEVDWSHVIGHGASLLDSDMDLQDLSTWDNGYVVLGVARVQLSFILLICSALSCQRTTLMHVLNELKSKSAQRHSHDNRQR